MRTNKNQVNLQGYVYDISKLSKRVTGANSKNPGTEYIGGELSIAIDEKGLNVVPVRFSYVTATYAKSGKPNNTYALLDKMINDPKTWLADGKDAAYKVRIDASLGLNDFISNDGQQVSAQVINGSFVSFVKELPEQESERNKFLCDVVVTRVKHIEAEAERHIDKDYVVVGGAAFDFRNSLLPMEFTVRNPAGMNIFEDAGVSAAEPLYTKVWGQINNRTITFEKVEESSFGASAVSTFERKSREWLIEGMAKVPYEFGEEGVMTREELTKAMQDREVAWAAIQKRHDERQTAQNFNAAPAVSEVSVKVGQFDF